MGVLWRNGPSTVRDVHTGLAGRGVGYTTVLKTMQIMAAKGLLLRDETERAHIYRPGLKQETAQRQIVGELLDRVFGGSAAALLQRALSERPASREELDEIRRMLRQMEGADGD